LLRKFKGYMPKIGNNCFVDPSAVLIGDVELGDSTSIWPNASIRGDLSRIRIGSNVSVQDNCIMHTDQDNAVEIGDDVVVGHGAIVHSSRIGSNTIIGIGAILLDNSRIGRDCIIGAGSVVTEGTEIPDGSVAMGIPAKVVKKTSEEHKQRIQRNLDEYRMLNEEHQKE
jgi:carbonic anhydrase/acetyltransferase-like protein (isoleucine patch superfamily)